MLSQLRPALATIALFILLTGLAYPLAVTGIAQLVLPHQANGSLVTASGGGVAGSELIAQGFTRPQYLHPRPSAAGSTGYDATSSAGSNLGPMDPKLAAAVKAAADTLHRENRDGIVPADAVTQSGSGLDPDVSPENAAFQAPRIAQARHASPDAVMAVIAGATRGPALGFLGQPHVNVLAVNRALDRRLPVSAR